VSQDDAGREPDASLDAARGFNDAWRSPDVVVKRDASGDGAVLGRLDSGPHDGSNPPHDVSVARDAATDAPPSWAPSMLGPSLVLWLDGDRGVATTPCGTSTCAAAWADQSGNANNANVPTATATPPMWEPGVYHGHGALRFDGNATSMSIADSPSLAVGSACTVITVIAEQTSFHLASVYSKTSLDSPYWGLALWGWYPSAGPAAQVSISQAVFSTQTDIDDGALHVLALSFATTVLGVEVDFGPLTTAEISAGDASLSAAGTPAYIGGNPAGGQVFMGDIAEVIIVMRSFDAADWANVAAYLDAKYGFT
jgi:hypothetical protein